MTGVVCERRTEEQEEVGADLDGTTGGMVELSKLAMRRGSSFGFAAGRFCRSELEAQQVLDQITLFSVGEAQVHTSVVVIHDGIQVGETSIVIEAAFEVG